MSFPRYPQYKDSGVEWLGEVPEHWGALPFKWVIDRNDGGAWGDDPTGKNDTIVLRSTDQTVDGQWKIVDPATRALSEKERLQTSLAEGDLVVTKSSGSSLHIGKTTLVTPEVASLGCCFGNFMQRLRMRPTCLPRLAWYLMNSDLARLQLDLLSNSTTGLANLNGTLIGEMQIALPPHKEQPAIVSFLDHETAKIDALIREQQRLIELLREKRQAVISLAVTKGLNPSVPMKGSGVEWLGEVPEHWEVGPFSLAIEFQEGPGIMAVDFHDEGVPLLRVAGAQNRWASLKGCNFLDPAKVKARWRHFQLDVGDLVISASASMGTVCEVGEEVAGAIPYTGLIRLKPIALRTTKDFVRSIVGSTLFSTQIDLFKAGSTIQHFGPTHLSQMKVVLPPIDEQNEISLYVDRLSEMFEALITEAEAGTKLLNERRSTLISAAVTGKIDVRNWKPPADESAFDEQVRKAGLEMAS